VGALANEGGLRRSDFGRIDIKPGFSLVELPDLDQDTLDKLSTTRISGVLIDLQPDAGPGRAPRSSYGDRGSRRDGRDGHGGRDTDRKPRHRQGRQG